MRMTMSKDPTKGLQLARQLRLDAQDCQRPDRAHLLESAAIEIESLIAEIKTLERPNPKA